MYKQNHEMNGLNKKKYIMINLIFALSMLSSSLLFTNCNADHKDEIFVPEYTLVTPYTNADTWVAYNAFNESLLDKNRKIYFRDTNRQASDANAVGAIWTQAIFWDMAMNAYKRDKDGKYLQLVNDLFEGNKNYYDNYNWNNGQVWFIYDDIMWWVISHARAYELFKDPKYLELAESGFKRVWSGSPQLGDPGSYDPVEGGMFWAWENNNPSKLKAGKMACINYPTIIAAMTLYNATGKAEYLSKAKEIYEWSYKNLFDNKRGLVADSRHGKANDWTSQVYNQATCIGAATMLYKSTGEQRYLDVAKLTADYTMNTMSAPLMIMPYKNGIEQGIYTAIFAQYIVRLIEDGNQKQYLPWLQRTINYGWKNRDKSRNLMGKNYTQQYTANDVIECYDASGITALMLVIPAEK
jgi:hypothetical protein